MIFEISTHRHQIQQQQHAEGCRASRVTDLKVLYWYGSSKHSSILCLCTYYIVHKPWSHWSRFVLPCTILVLLGPPPPPLRHLCSSGVGGVTHSSSNSAVGRKAAAYSHQFLQKLWAFPGPSFSSFGHDIYFLAGPQKNAIEPSNCCRHQYQPQVNFPARDSSGIEAGGDAGRPLPSRWVGIC